MDQISTGLKSVFDACDTNGDGFVRTLDLIQYSGGGQDRSKEEVQTLIDKLDPDGVGRITFEEFCRRYRELGGGNGDVDAIDGGKLPSHDSEFLEDSCFEGDSTYSTTSTNDYNGDDDDTFQDPRPFQDHNGSSFLRNQMQYSTFPPPTESKRRAKKHHTPPRLCIDSSHHSDTSEYQSEEGYEGYGESFSEDSTLGSGTLKGSMTDQQFHKSISSSSLQHRRVSAAKAALMTSSPAYRSYSANTSRRNSSDDIFYDDRPMSDTEAGASSFLYNEIRRLSSQVSMLTEDHHMQTNQQDRIKYDNRDLTLRINALEEQLEAQKLSASQLVSEESKKHKQVLTKLSRENEEHLIELKEKLHDAEKEIAQLKTIEPMLRKELDDCLEEKRHLVQQRDELENTVNKKQDEIEALNAKLEILTREVEEERHRYEEEIAHLTEQLECMERTKTEAEDKLAEMPNIAQRITDLEKLVQQLTKENNNLKHTKDDALLVQLTQNGHYKVQQEPTKSLADELMSANKDTVIDALRDQEEEARRLRGYLDSLLMIIMEHNPSLLEIT
ncbi:rab11 family-interacting protein 3 isoform X1 [Nematostella vectensis]|uniref:rab11 family-interacting protein 3 isoform X1 n=1 Tax=Nematostella vectensis TaxID=45351 RepID=UPI002076E345|nr:rab11 family-interacting protein 3 isoform X1 [Nematostella vectensis]